MELPHSRQSTKTLMHVVRHSSHDAHFWEAQFSVLYAVWATGVATLNTIVDSHSKARDIQIIFSEGDPLGDPFQGEGNFFFYIKPTPWHTEGGGEINFSSLRGTRDSRLSLRGTKWVFGNHCKRTTVGKVKKPQLLEAMYKLGL